SSNLAAPTIFLAGVFRALPATDGRFVAAPSALAAQLARPCGATKIVPTVPSQRRGVTRRPQDGQGSVHPPCPALRRSEGGLRGSTPADGRSRRTRCDQGVWGC